MKGLTFFLCAARRRCDRMRDDESDGGGVRYGAS